MNKVFAVGVGPGSPKYVTDIVKDAISQCDVVIGYGYTIKTIEEYVKNKKDANDYMAAIMIAKGG